MTHGIFDADIIQTQIDTDWKDSQEDGRRGHLGGSLIGRECERELWYSFRWFTDTKHDGRILRLFDRGHKEEFRFVDYLRRIGVEVRDYEQQLWCSNELGEFKLLDWDADLSGGIGSFEPVHDNPALIELAEKHGQGPTQYRISDVDGHFGGSLDAICFNVPGVEAFGLTVKDPVLAEFKTHGQKSFDNLCKKGLLEAKPEHVAQMRVYMTKRGIKLALYMAVNKNTDELKCFFVVADGMQGAALLGKARDIIHAPTPPRRMHGATPSFFKCRFCDHRAVCHLGERAYKSCRSCVFAKPVAKGVWGCAKWQAAIPKDAQKVGCDEYTEIVE